jgi:hypothetical protein
LGKVKEMQGQLSIVHATLKKSLDVTKIEANVEVLIAAGKACDAKLPDNDDVFETEMDMFGEEIEDVMVNINEAIDALEELVKTFNDKANEVVGVIDGAISEL